MIARFAAHPLLRSTKTRFVAMSLMSSASSVVLCEGAESEDKDKGLPDFVQDFRKDLDPADGYHMGHVAGSATTGGIMGFSAGYALKKMGKAATVGVGVLFMTFQTAAYFGYVKVDWDKIDNDLRTRLDVNNDGVVDDKDVNIIAADLVKVFTSHMGVTATGFAGGLLLGFRAG
eukprot:Clim_evm19s3 gene=Clim_evmTU19s3